MLVFLTICSSLVYTLLIHLSGFVLEARESKQFLMSPAFNYNPFDWNYGSTSSSEENHDHISDGLPSVESRINLNPIDLLFPSCNNNWMQPLFGRCCNEFCSSTSTMPTTTSPAPCSPKLETITLCQDASNVFFPILGSSAPVGKIDGISGNYSTCLAVISPRSYPNTRIQLTCPVVRNVTKYSLQIFEPSSYGSNVTLVAPDPIEKDVIYTTKTNIVYFIVGFLNSKPIENSTFTCEWKVIP